MSNESQIIDVVAEEVEKLTEEVVTSEETAPLPTPEQTAAQEKMKVIATEIGNAYIQDAARLLANIAGTMGNPLSFAYNTESGGKALVFAISSTSEEIFKLAKILDATVTTKSPNNNAKE
jgi:hypothetical protein